MANKFKTEKYTLEKLVDSRFIIPSYQRPYVWGKEQIDKLLSDFHEAFSRNDMHYYIGTVLLYEQKTENNTIYQLIDGQQRFTTLWLAAVSFKLLNADSEIEEFLKVGDELRLDFAIRKQIKLYMQALLKNEKKQYSDDKIKEDEYLTKIAEAVTIIIGKIKNIRLENRQDLKSFGNYIYKHIHFVVNTVPEDTDLNKLFSVINNSGIQLEQSDILKSLLLKKIKTEKPFYSRIWEACENMSNFFERNVKQLFPKDFDLAKDYADLKEFCLSNNNKLPNEAEQNNTLTIADILDNKSIYNLKVRPKNFGKETITFVEKAKLSDIQSISGKLFGKWIRKKNEEVDAEYCLLSTSKADVISVQLQIWDDNFAKGVEIELSQNGQNIDAYIVWAKGSKKRSEAYKLLLGKDWNSEVESFDNVPIGENGYGVSEIIINPIEENNSIKQDIDNEENIDRCRSIIKFPQLLIHTYRIFLHDKEENDFDLPFHSDKLIQIFKPLIQKDEQIIKDFFKYLWKVRWIFDKEIVKWIPKTDGEREEELHLTTISRNEYNFDRSNKEKNDVSMLQSVMYFTGNYNTQIWLTPYLKRLLDGEDSLTCLESIDNKLSLSNKSDKETTFSLILRDYDLSEKFDFEKYLMESRGTGFRHYWFQKLEYILWKEFKGSPKYQADKMFEKYRITSKNSVEHVFPQNHEFGNQKIEEKYLNDFGNLALLNVSQNSSYSNQDVQKKKIDFDSKQTYDSLKLALIYEDADLKNYNEQKIELHRDAMIEKIVKHYSK